VYLCKNNIFHPPSAPFYARTSERPFHKQQESHEGKKIPYHIFIGLKNHLQQRERNFPTGIKKN